MAMTSQILRPNQVTMKPRAPTVAARFSDSLNALLATLNSCPNPFYIRCLKPNADKTPMKFDMPVVLEQLRYTGMLETIRIRKAGFPARMKYLHFVRRYRCLLHGRDPRGAPTKEVARVILDSMQPSLRARKESRRELYALGAHKVGKCQMGKQGLTKQRARKLIEPMIALLLNKFLI